eukprot:scaffold70994_cov19-Prasinocladus_malaysianus.AAC.2
MIQYRRSSTMSASNDSEPWTELSLEAAVERLRRNDPTLKMLKVKKSDGGKLHIDPPGGRDQKQHA